MSKKKQHAGNPAHIQPVRVEDDPVKLFGASEDFAASFCIPGDLTELYNITDRDLALFPTSDEIAELFPTSDEVASIINAADSQTIANLLSDENCTECT